jgi:hypothetical protein
MVAGIEAEDDFRAWEAQSSLFPPKLPVLHNFTTVSDFWAKRGRCSVIRMHEVANASVLQSSESACRRVHT